MKISNQYVESLSNESLLENLKVLTNQERKTVAAILLHLTEIEKRELHLELGFSSMFAYLTERLKYSEPDAGRKLAAARVIARFPELLSDLINGELSLATLALISGVLTEESKEELLQVVRGKSKRAVEEYLAQRKPRSKPRESIKPIAVSSAPSSLFSAQVTIPGESSPKTAVESSMGNTESKLVPESPSEKRFELQFSVSEETFSKHKEVQMLLSNKYPKGASLEEAYNELLEMFLNNKSPKRRAERRLNRATKQLQSKGRYIPVSVKDLVFNRDGACCGYVGKDGHKCGSIHELEIDHIRPFAMGGGHDRENLRVLCGNHNRYRSGRRGTVPGYGVSMTRRNKFGDSPGAVGEA